MSQPFLSIIIPAYNEAHRLPDTLREVQTFLNAQAYESDLWVIENGSSDETLSIARAYQAQMPNLHVVHLDQAGKGLAVRRGMLEADGQYRFICDADLSMPIDQVNRFLPPALETDIAIASREAPGAIRYEEPEYRHTIGRVFNYLVSLLALPGLQDTQCGFKCFKAHVAEDIFRYQTRTGWAFDVEVLYIARMRGYDILEVGIPWHYRKGSKVSVIRDAWKMFSDLLAIRRNARAGLYDPEHETASN